MSATTYEIYTPGSTNIEHLKWTLWLSRCMDPIENLDNPASYGDFLVTSKPYL